MFFGFCFPSIHGISIMFSFYQHCPAAGPPSPPRQQHQATNIVYRQHMSLLVFTRPHGSFDGIGTLHLKTLQLQCSAHNLPAIPSKTICHDWLATKVRKKLHQTYLLSFAKAEWPPAMRDGSRSPRLSWGLLKKDLGWLGVCSGWNRLKVSCSLRFRKSPAYLYACMQDKPA